MSRLLLPPLALDDAQVVAFLHVDQSIRLTGKLRLFAGRQLLGRVPNLAIARRHEARELLVFHCDEKWDVVAVQEWNGPAGAHVKTIDDVKGEMEEYYEGSVFAVRWGMLGEAQRMLEQGADQNLRTYEHDPRTPLLMAAKSGNHDLLELLRKHGAKY
jgi:hypothetical protein